MKDLVYVRSSHCGNGVNVSCVECAADGGRVSIRKSSDQLRFELTASQVDYDRFHTGVATGYFDYAVLKLVDRFVDGSCLRVRRNLAGADDDGFGGNVEIRMGFEGSSHPTVLTFSRDEWLEFVAACKRRELTYDRLVAGAEQTVAA